MPTQSKHSSPDKLPCHLNPPNNRELVARAAAKSGKVYGYCRLSTLAQAQDGESLEVQQRTLAGYAQMNGASLHFHAPELT